jgi:hypothetical protein
MSFQMAGIVCILAYQFLLSSALSANTNPKTTLVNYVKDLKYGVRATPADMLTIESLVKSVVDDVSLTRRVSSPADAFTSRTSSSLKSILTGNWTLLYTNGPDVLSIGKIPGVNLDYVGQKVEVDKCLITNYVRASGFLADTSQEVYVNVNRVSSTKVELDFYASRIKVDKIFGWKKFLWIDVDSLKPFEIIFNKEEFQKALKRSNRPTPAFTIEYLDNDLRIQRTGEGYLFIIQRQGVVSSEVTLLKDGLGPWLTEKIGANGMFLLGFISITPYIMFGILAIQQGTK